MIAALILLCFVAAGDEEEGPRTGLGFAGLPLVNYNSDDGFGYGARAVLYDYGEGQMPYRYVLTAQFFQTTKQVAAHRLIFDAPHLAGTDWRIDGELRYYAEKSSPYYGLGNRSAYDPSRSAEYYSYDWRAPQFLINFRRQLVDDYPLQFFGGYFAEYSLLAAASDSKLIEDFRAGVPLAGLTLHGGGSIDSVATGELTVGLIIDSRDNEPAPSEGVFHELSLRGAAPLIGSDFDYFGGNLTLRFYEALDEERTFVLAGRLVFDFLDGDVPFFRLSKTGGLHDLDAVGGLTSVRGILRNRYVGKIKLFANPEARWTFADTELFSQHIQLTLIAALDVGRAWADWHKDGPLFAFAYGAAGGLRIGFNENFVVRVDYARELGGDGTSGLYIDFNHTF